MDKQMKRAGAALALFALLVPMIVVLASGNPASAGKGRPNFIVILTDDQDASSIRYLPAVRKMAREGVTFRNFFVTTPICCPSRVSILSGQYAHNHRILYNDQPGGGFTEFHNRPVERNNLAIWLEDAGYRTGFYGKFLNGYPGKLRADWISPGWTDWAAILSGHYFDFALNVNGERVVYTGKRSNSTTTIGKLAESTIEDSAANGQPFFLLISTQAAHTPLKPERRYEGRFARVSAPRGANFGELDTRDKPEWVREWGSMTPQRAAAIDASYRDRLETLMSVDAMLADLRRTLKESGQADNTWIFFTSDNGWLTGAHNAEGKQAAYDESAKVPMVVFGPGVRSGATLDALALNIDIAPTVLDLAGERIPNFVDGRSFAPFLQGGRPASWRSYAFLEYFRGNGPDRESGDPAPLSQAEIDAAWDYDLDAFSVRPPGLGALPMPYKAVRSPSHLYVQYAVTGERELYDLNRDPARLCNLLGDLTDADCVAQAAVPPAPELVMAFERQIAGMAACQGAQCRAREQ